MTQTPPETQRYDVNDAISYIGAMLGSVRGQPDYQNHTAGTSWEPGRGAPDAPHATSGGAASYPGGYSYAGQGGGTSDWDTFYSGLLSKLGLPETPANMAFLRAWNQAEGMQTSTNNPFATTQGAEGAGSINSVGVKSYRDMDQGIQATVETLQNGYYDDILAALRAGNDPMAAAVAVANSPWGTGSLVMRVLESAPSSATGGGTLEGYQP